MRGHTGEWVPLAPALAPGDRLWASVLCPTAQGSVLSCAQHILADSWTPSATKHLSHLLGTRAGLVSG